MTPYTLHSPESIDSPALLLYPDRIDHNIRTMLAMVGGNAERLMPHVKTYKMPEIVRMQVEAGIEQFKCATIAEAEMMVDTGARRVLIAYQLTGPKLARFRELADAYEWVEWASLVDNADSAAELAEAFAHSHRRPVVYVDVNTGMNRTGHPVGASLEELYRHLLTDNRLDLRGFHAYDGHQRDPDFDTRFQKATDALRPVIDLADRLETETGHRVAIIAGGTPTFSVHSRNGRVICSPGTCLLWDWGYDDLLPEQDFEWAALLLTRVVSKPAPGLITTDLGHKAVAAENPIGKRIKFLNLSGYEPVGQSEEHLVLRVDDWESIRVGDVLYGVPYHICPTVALHETVAVVENGEVVDSWQVTARKRRLTL